MTIRTHIGLFLLFFTVITFYNVNSQSQRELLELAYKNNDYNLLDTFFARWQKENTAISKEKYEYLSDVEKDVYNIFYTCYKPLDLKSIKWGFEEFSNKGCKYLVLQNSIYYEVVRTLNKDSLYNRCVTIAKYMDDTAKLAYLEKRKDKITWEDPFLSDHLFSEKEYISKKKMEEFYPYDSYNGLRIVYETDFYKIILSSFLWNNKNSDYKYPGINKTRASKAELETIDTEFEKRRLFLDKVVRTAERKGCGSLYQIGSQKHFSKYPDINFIYIDVEGLYALAILFFDGDEEILLPLKKVNGIWIIDN